MHEVIEYLDNASSKPLVAWLEPMSTAFDIPPGQRLRLVGRGTKPGHFEIDKHDEGVIVYAWPSAAVAVYLGDNLVAELAGLFSDVLPPDMSVKKFLASAFAPTGLDAVTQLRKAAQSQDWGPWGKRKPWWKFW
jgi:hypothetical protein